MKHIALLFILISLQVQAEKPHQTVDKEAIRIVIRDQGSKFMECYSPVLKKDKKVDIKVVLNWDIGSKGEVQKSKIESTTLKNATAEDCMLATLKTLKFPKSDEVSNVNFPFVFSNIK